MQGSTQVSVWDRRRLSMLETEHQKSRFPASAAHIPEVLHFRQGFARRVPIFRLVKAAANDFIDVTNRTRSDKPPLLGLSVCRNSLGFLKKLIKAIECACIHIGNVV